MAKIIDGVIKEWGDRTTYGKVKKGKVKNIGGGKNYVNKPTPTSRPRGKLLDTIKKSPEVMVKISSSGKDMKKIKAHLDYISRHGDVELEDENGYIYTGKDDVIVVKDNWNNSGYRIKQKDGTRRESFNIVLSMPPNTDRASVKKAAREFANTLFKDNQYVFAAHNDEKHPHVHIAVKAMDKNGVRLNPRKADLQNWREIFAEKLREQGIEANATPRRLRGITRKGIKQAVKSIDDDFRAGKRASLSKVTTGQLTDARNEIETNQKRTNPALNNIIEARKEVVTGYAKVAKALAMGSREDKQLAIEITNFVKDMPPVKKGLHEQLVQHSKNDITLKNESEFER